MVGVKLPKKPIMLAEVKPEDLVKYGLIPEFIGRLCSSRRTHSTELVRILKETKNSLLKQYRKLFLMEGAENLCIAQQAEGTIMETIMQMYDLQPLKEVWKL